MPSLMKNRNESSLLLTVVGVGVGLYLADILRKKIGKNHKYEVPEEIRKSPLAREAQVAVTLALKAGRNMFSYCDEKGTEAEFNHDLGISEKGQPENFCTVIDVENEKLVMKGLLESFPTHKLIGEETTGTGEIPPLTKEHPTWIIDPIDGTTNFASGLPLTCVSIGLCVSGKPVLGVVYAPMTDELYVAVAGHGAYRNGVRLRKQQSAKQMAEAVVGFEFGYARGKEKCDKMLTMVGRIMENGCLTMRSLGSGVLDLVYVATGRMVGSGSEKLLRLFSFLTNKFHFIPGCHLFGRNNRRLEAMGLLCRSSDC